MDDRYKPPDFRYKPADHRYMSADHQYKNADHRYGQTDHRYTPTSLQVLVFHDSAACAPSSYLYEVQSVLHSFSG